jgi:hypothetical protein
VAKPTPSSSAPRTDGPLAHLPSGSLLANAAGVALVAITCNLLRAVGVRASLTYARARGAILRRDQINVAARTARHGRGSHMVRVTEGWHREHRWMNPVLVRRRPARRCGLTSPDPVIAPSGPRQTAGHYPGTNPWTRCKKQ